MSKKQKNVSFGDMTCDQINQWEKETNSVVLFHNETSIAFQKAKLEDSDKPALAIMIDGVKPIILLESCVNTLKNYLNRNF